jgi:hypothetical protein
VGGVTDGAAEGSIGCTATVLLSVAPAWGGSGVEPLFIGWAGGATGSGAMGAPRHADLGRLARQHALQPGATRRQKDEEDSENARCRHQGHSATPANTISLRGQERIQSYESSGTSIGSINERSGR